MTTTTMPSTLDVHVDRGLADLREPSVRRRLVGAVDEAMELLDHGAVDVVVFAARRMFCLFVVLQSLGLPEPRRGRVVSDRFLEVLPDGAWQDQRVLLVDDTTLTGLTLEHRMATLGRLVGPFGSVDKRIALDPPAALSTPEDRRDWLERETGGDLHAQFAGVFGRNLVPYFTDFAVSRTATVRGSQLVDLLTSDEWQTVDVTNHAVAGSGARSYSLFPSTATRAAMRDHLGSADAAVELAKVRLFVRQRGADLDLRVVPVVLIRSFDRERVDDLLRDSGRGDPIPAAAAEQLTGIATLELSRLLLRFVSQRFAPLLDVEVEEDHAHMALVLGDLKGWTGIDWPWEKLVRNEPAGPAARSELVDGRTNLIIGDDAVEGLLRRFEALAEQPVDETARERTPLHDLAEEYGRSVVDLSIALDLGNDLGSVVPSHLVSEQSIERAYRPGESHDVRPRPSVTGGRYASVSRTIRLDGRLRPVEWSRPASKSSPEAGARD